jgi:cytoskeletal protein CcmA (bactofilin family)
MWSRKNEEPAPQRPAPPSPIVNKETAPMSSIPQRNAEPHVDAPRGGAAVLGKSVMVKGQIFSREDLTIDGEVEGTVELQEHRLTVGPNGRVQAGIKAREIVVLGTIHGNVEATEKIDIRKDAKLVGDIKTARIVIEDGAYFKGSIDITKPEARPQPQRQQPAAQPAAQTAAPAAVAAEAKR